MMSPAERQFRKTSAVAAQNVRFDREVVSGPRHTDKCQAEGYKVRLPPSCHGLTYQLLVRVWCLVFLVRVSI